MTADLAHWLTLWSAIFSLDLVRYFVGVGAVVLALLLCSRGWVGRRRIQARRATARDRRREIGHSVLTALVYATVGVATIAAYEAGWTPRLWSSPRRYGLAWGVVALPLLLVLHDAWFYWTHRAMHHPALFRRLHRVHHLSRTPTPWAAYSFAPGEAMVAALFLPIASVLMPLQNGTIFAFMLFMIVRNGVGHSGIEVHPRWWLDSPLDALTTVTHHDLHHERVHGNYGLYFTWWDRWMGTELPDYAERFRQVTAARAVDRGEGAGPAPARAHTDVAPPAA